MKIFNRYQLEFAFYNDDTLIVPDTPEIPSIHGCVCKITNLDNKQQKTFMVPVSAGFVDTPTGRENLRNVAFEKMRQALVIYERNLQTLRASKS